jgi:large conductance mechanosensitive channel
MLQDYRDFILKTNTLALAIGVIVGAATSKLVGSIVDDLFMPIISCVLPEGGWASAQWIISQSIDSTGKVTINSIKYGHFISAIIDFLVISFVVFVMTKFLGVRQSSLTKNKECPACLEIIPVNAKTCRACCTQLILQ